MKRLRKILLWLLGVTAGLYVLLCVLMYFNQELLIFHPAKLETGYAYKFNQPFEELNIAVSDGKKINGLLLKCDSSKGLIFYLHGNAGALDTWGDIAQYYAPMQYDVFVMDYRGFGKSEGSIYSEKQFFDDAQTAYNEMKKRYAERNIVITGYSIGTGAAALLASQNDPKLLVLQAPYFSLTDMMHHTYPFVPDFLLKYKFNTYEYLQKTAAPVMIFHGDADEIIYYGSSLKLKEHFKAGDQLITLPGSGHLGLNKNMDYLLALARALR